jgi:Flp pilus assembly protein TadD
MIRRIACTFTTLATVSAACMLTACSSTQPTQHYTNTASEDDFARAANRPPTPETLYRTARILSAQHKDDESEAVLRNCMERYPEYMPAYAELAELQIRQRKMAAAVGTLKDGLALKPKEAVLLNDMGMVHMITGDYETALNFFRQASESAPDDARFTTNVALAQGMLGHYDESLSSYMSVMRPGPAHYNLAVVAEARNDMDRANQEYATALSLDPWCQRKTRSNER